MIYWKEECQGLVNSQSLVVVVDHYDENRVPVFAIRRAQSAVGSRSGKNSYWSVTFDEPLSDECNAVTFPFILATMEIIFPNVAMIDGIRLDQYHPAWTLTPSHEFRLNSRKEDIIRELNKLANKINK